MSLFTKPLSALTYEDVENFLASREPEGLRVEYKIDFPQKNEDFAKSVAAMANAEGGIILLGVPTDAQNRPEAPIGIPSRGNVPNRIADICAAKIRPTISPEVRTFDLKRSDGGQVVVLRVPASQLAPHYLPEYSGNPLIPVRVDGKISTADVPTIEALQRRRHGDITAAKRGAGMSNPPIARSIFKEATGRELAEEEVFSIRIIIYATLGPERICILTNDLDERLRDLLPYACPFDTSSFDFGPPPRTKRISGFTVRRSQEDVQFTCAGERDGQPVCIAVRVTQSGAIQFGTIVRRNEFYLGRFLRDVVATLDFAKAFFEQIGYFGTAEFWMLLENVHPSGTEMTLNTGDGRSFMYQSGQHVEVKGALDAGWTTEPFHGFIKDVLRRMLREGNIPVTEGFLDDAARFR